MRKMKYSGIPTVGNIPDRWSIPKIKHHAVFFNGDRSSNYPSGDEIVSLGVPFITSDNIHDIVLDCNRNKNKYITREKYESLRGAKIKLNDIIYCLRGSLGACAINKSITEGTVASSLVVIRAKSTLVPDYFNYFLHSQVVNSQVDEYMNGSCAANLSAESVGSFFLILPPEEEQFQIVDYLDNKCSKIDEAISRHNTIIEKLEEYKRATIIYKVSHTDKNVEYVDSNIPWMPTKPKTWETLPLKYAVTQRINKNTDMCEKNLLTLSYGEIKRKNIETNEGLLPASFEGYNIIEKGDIVLRLLDLQNDTHSLRTGLVTERGIITSAYVTITPSSVFDSMYCRYLLHAYDLMKVLYTMGEGVRQSLSFDELSRKTLVLVPPIDEQRKIAKDISIMESNVNEAIARMLKNIEKLKEYKKSLIYNAVTGKIDCRK